MIGTEKGHGTQMYVDGAVDRFDDNMRSNGWNGGILGVRQNPPLKDRFVRCAVRRGS